MNMSQALRVYLALSSIADGLLVQVSKLKGTVPLGDRGLPGFDTVGQVTDACLELERQIDNLKEAVARLEQEQNSPELYRLVEKYELDRAALGLNSPA